MGFLPKPFYISVNHLEGYKSLEEVNALIKKNGFKLNESGGEIKGSPEDLLEQSSIIADLCAVDFLGKAMKCQVVIMSLPKGMKFQKEKCIKASLLNLQIRFLKALICRNSHFLISL
ncbi:MAG: hypothetical protein CM15mP22_6610 [Gammaproteobacteria bacterium]|nr:MAG: hypothetical protein CM15mP22_6610 [Gammaproteobacteria bacterium]